MTPDEKLKEIEKAKLEMIGQYIESWVGADDVEWLIHRNKMLSLALRLVKGNRDSEDTIETLVDNVLSKNLSESELLELVERI